MEIYKESVLKLLKNRGVETLEATGSKSNELRWKGKRFKQKFRPMETRETFP